MNFYTVTAELDFGVLGRKDVEIEYEPAGGEVTIISVWISVCDNMMDIFMWLTDEASDKCFDIARQDLSDRRQDAAEYMEER